MVYFDYIIKDFNPLDKSIDKEYNVHAHFYKG